MRRAPWGPTRKTTRPAAIDDYQISIYNSSMPELRCTFSISISLRSTANKTSAVNPWSFDSLNRFVTFLGLAICLINPLCANAADNWRDKIGVYVTPWSDGDSRFPAGYSDAIKTLQSHASTVWILESWAAIETAPNRFDWTSLDQRVKTAVDAGFTVGLRIQVILSGNDAQKRWVGVSRIPRFYDQNMGSRQFREKATAFYGQIAQRYKGGARYIAVGNTVNKYFEKNLSQWKGFQQSYNAIVDAIHQAAPGMLVVADLNPGGEFFTNPERLKEYVDFFSQSHDDLPRSSVLFHSQRVLWRRLPQLQYHHLSERAGRSAYHGAGEEALPH